VSDIKVAFWNLQNLFDITSNEVASDLEFTPERGWTSTVLEKKLQQLADGMKLINYDKTNSDQTKTNRQGPDLLGLSEIENEDLARRLIGKIGRNDYEVATYNDSSDIRGIDTCLIYSKDIFEFISAKSHNIHFRYPTRDIFEVHLKVKENGAELNVLVNHWPSRRGKGESCDPNDTEPARCMVGEHCSRIVNGFLKIPRKDLYSFPDDILEGQESLTKLDKQWNSNVLLMGDFNDEPFDKSVMKYLGAIFDSNLMRKWKEILDLLIRQAKENSDKTHKEYYLEQPASLYNCMWHLLQTNNISQNMMEDRPNRYGSFYYWQPNALNQLDHFIISRGLYYAEQSLKMNLESVKVAKAGLSLGDNCPNIFSQGILPQVMKASPMNFEYQKYYRDREGKMQPDKLYSITKGREANTGYSDHFPIQCVIENV
jgi:hypothetical protein